MVAALPRYERAVPAAYPTFLGFPIRPSDGVCQPVAIATRHSHARPTEHERDAAAIERLCRTESDPRQLRLRILEHLKGIVDFDSYAWVLTDPLTCVGSAPIAEVPDLAMLPDLIRLKYATSVNRWTTLEGAGARSLHDATAGRLHESPVWRGLLRHYGVTDVASMAFWDRHGCWAFLDLWRRAPKPPFSHSELDTLSQIVEAVTPALRQGQAGLFRADSPSELDRGPVVLVLTPQLHVVGETAETAATLRQLVPPADGQAPIPASAYNVAAQLLAAEAGVDDHPAWTRAHLTGGVWLTVRAARLGAAADPVTGANESPIAVTLERCNPAERAGLFAKACGFSTREQELLDLLAAGADTRGAATAMFVSEYTVQDHLKSMFEKASVHSRRTLLAHALGS